MRFPTSREYDEVVNPLSESLLDVDECIRRGVAWPVRPTGVDTEPENLAAVYRVEYVDVNGDPRVVALRCFTDRIAPSEQIFRRYEELQRELPALLDNHAVSCIQFVTNGIHVPGVDPVTEHFPVVLMEWIDGYTLVEYLDIICQFADAPSRIDRLIHQWVALVASMEQRGIAHGDLSGNNIMVRSNGTLVLIDYDFFYIPSMGVSQEPAVGQGGFRDPQIAPPALLRSTMDRFAALVIYTALVVLRAKPSFWYECRADRRTNNELLFQQRDLNDPIRSRLFADIIGIDDERVSIAVWALWRACERQPDELDALSDLLDSEASRRTTRQESLQVRLDHGRLFIRCDLANRAKDSVQISWRADSWPQTPEDTAAVHRFVRTVDVDVLHIDFVIPSGSEAGSDQLYVCIYPAALDPLKQWRASSWEPLERGVARTQRRVISRITARLGLVYTVDIWTDDGSSLPRLTVVRSTHPTRTFRWAWIPVMEVGGDGRSFLQKVIPSGEYPERSYVRVIAADPAEVAWIQVVSDDASGPVVPVS